MIDRLMPDSELLGRLRDALGQVPRVAYAGAHVYPAAAPAFVPAPRTQRPRPDHSHLRLYVHVPFCSSRCSFCFYAVKVAKNRAQMERYVDALERELACVEPGMPLSQLFVGGGTPTVLPADLLARLLGAIFDRMPPYGNHVHVVEASPDTVTAKHAQVLCEHGVERVSMGIQSLETPVLDSVRRGHDEGAALDAVRLLLDHGLILNVDLMYGLPGQTEASFRRDVERLEAEGVHSLTLYELRLLKTSPVARHLREDEWLSFDRLVRWRATVKSTAEELGFTQTRWHTFKRLDGPAAKHERLPEHTTVGSGYQLGIGLSARSHIGPTIFRNHRSFDTYLARIEADESPVEDVFELGDDDRRILYIARSLGDGHPLDAAAYEAAFGTTLDGDHGAVLRRLTGAGALARSDSNYRLTEAGKLVYDLVTLAFYPARMQEWLKARQPSEFVGDAAAW